MWSAVKQSFRQVWVSNAAGISLLVVLASLLRGCGLNTYSLWLDEIIQYGMAAAPFERIICDIPPDWMFLSVFITKLNILADFEATAWQLRLPSVIFGVMTVIAIFLLAKEMFNQRTAWVAGVAAAVWPRLIEYSQEMRAYAFFALAAAIAGYALLCAFRTERAWCWAVFAGACVLEIYNHFLAALNVFSFFLFILVLVFLETALGRGRPRTFFGDLSIAWKRLSVAALAFLGIAVGFLPVLASYVRLMVQPTANSFGSLPLNSALLTEVFGSYLGFGSGLRFTILMVLVIAGFGYACLRFRSAAILAAMWISVPLGFAVVSSGGNLFKRSPRYLLFLVPVLLPVLAAGIVLLADGVSAFAARYLGSFNNFFSGRKSWTVIFTIAFVGMMVPDLIALYQNNPKQIPVDLRSAYAYVLGRATTHDVILGLGQKGLWPSGWFKYTNMYFMRPQVTPPGVTMIVIGSDSNRGEIPFDRIDASPGKLYALIGLNPREMAKVRRAAEGAFTTVCWDHICVLESVSDTPMRARVDDLFARFAFIDPAGLTPLPELHRRTSTVPYPSPPP